MTTRAARLDALERLWSGEQYAARPSFWDDSVPLQERSPCVNSTVAATAGERLIAMVFGASRFPRIVLATGKSPVLDALLSEALRVARFPRRMRAVLRSGLKVGTTVPYVRILDGKPELRLLRARFCTPQYEGRRLTSVEVCYRYYEGDKEMVYRRVIDAQADTTYVPREADSREAWQVAESVPHKLGFVPVLWHRHDEDEDTDDLDGRALFAGMEDEILALDLAYSQAHRNARYNGDPQIVLSGVDDESVGAAGRRADPAAAGFWPPLVKAAQNWMSSGGGALKKAPGRVWKLSKPDARAEMLESTGAGANILAADVDRLRRLILDSRGIVIASPEQVSANASAALLKELYAPMVAQADTLREEYGELLCDLVNLLLRVLRVVAGRGELVSLASLPAALPLLQADLPLELRWGDYFEPTWQDVQAAVTAASTGAAGGVVLPRRALHALLSRVVELGDEQEYTAALAAETAETHSMQMDALARSQPQPPDLP